MDDQPILLLLGDLGRKSFFTYAFARQLATRWSGR